MKHVILRPALLALTLLLAAGAIFFLENRFQSADAVDETAPSVEVSSQADESSRQDGERGERPAESNGSNKAGEYPVAEEITRPTGFINTDGVSIGESRGEKVVLLDFWTYSCVNCQNTQPYLNAWHERYADEGLQIIGVHKPEFEFEKDPASVEAAVREAGIEYPVVLDNDDATWEAYDQSYWPTMYLIDADGFVRYEHIGEGAYAETEAEIQKLLAEKDREVRLGRVE